VHGLRFRTHPPSGQLNLIPEIASRLIVYPLVLRSCGFELKKGLEIAATVPGLFAPAARFHACTV
jgi:hypothetical protein